MKRHDLYVLSDEIYSNLHIRQSMCPFHPFRNEGKNTGDQQGFSKGFAMTGWRLGYICRTICDHRTDSTKIHQFAIMYCADQQPVCSHRGLRHCEDEMQQMRNAYNQGEYLVNEFHKDEVRMLPSRFGAVNIFPEVSKEFGMTSEEFGNAVPGREERVAVVPGSAFGEGSGEGFLRVSYAYSLEDLKEAIGRLQSVLLRD